MSSHNLRLVTLQYYQKSIYRVFSLDLHNFNFEFFCIRGCNSAILFNIYDVQILPLLSSQSLLKCNQSLYNASNDLVYRLNAGILLFEYFICIFLLL